MAANHTPSQWTSEKKQLLLQLFAEGKSAAQVAVILNTSRNAAIGMVHRLGKQINVLRNTERHPHELRQRVLRVRKRLNIYRINEVRERPILRYKPVRDPSVVYLPRKRKKPVNGCSLLQLDQHTCHWPLWNHDGTGDRLYCGTETNGKVYCEEHRAKAKRFVNNAQEYSKRDPSRDFVINRRPAKSPKSIVL